MPNRDLPDYYRWVSSTWKPNLPVPDKNKELIYIWSDGTLIFMSPDREHSIPLTDRPYSVGFTFASTWCGMTWENKTHAEVPCAVIPTAMSIPDKPGQSKIVIGLWAQGYNQPDSGVAGILRNLENKGMLMMGGYQLDKVTGKVFLNGAVFDIMQENLPKFPDILDRINRFEQTLDPSTISDPDLYFGVNALGR